MLYGKSVPTGEQVRDDGRRLTNRGTPSVGQCSRCDADFEEGDLWCSSCGAELPARKSSPLPPTEAEKMLAFDAQVLQTEARMEGAPISYSVALQKAAQRRPDLCAQHVAEMDARRSPVSKSRVPGPAVVLQAMVNVVMSTAGCSAPIATDAVLSTASGRDLFKAANAESRSRDCS